MKPSTFTLHSSHLTNAPIQSNPQAQPGHINRSPTQLTQRPKPGTSRLPVQCSQPPGHPPHPTIQDHPTVPRKPPAPHWPPNILHSHSTGVWKWNNHHWCILDQLKLSKSWRTNHGELMAKSCSVFLALDKIKTSSKTWINYWTEDDLGTRDIQNSHLFAQQVREFLMPPMLGRQIHTHVHPPPHTNICLCLSLSVRQSYSSQVEISFTLCLISK